MKKLTILMAALSIVIPSIAHSSAVLVDAKGNVSVTVRGVPKPAKIGMELPDGSSVDVTSGGAQVLLESGAMDRVAAGTKYTVGGKSKASSSTDLGSGITIAMRELAASGDAPTVHGMVKKVEGPKDLRISFGAKSGKGLYALYPRSTAIDLGERTNFIWSKPIDFKDPVLVVDDAKKKRIALANLKAGDTSFDRRTAKLHLKSGESFSWFLAERKGNDVKGKTARFTFKTLSKPEAAALAGEMGKVRSLDMSADGKRFLEAQIYFQHGMYYDAANALKSLYGKSKAPFIKKLLRLSYTKMGLANEAEKYK